MYTRSFSPVFILVVPLNSKGSPVEWFKATGSTWIQGLVFPGTGHIVGTTTLLAAAVVGKG
jgi:hypothetical protein